jgi:hypothetical protein
VGEAAAVGDTAGSETAAEGGDERFVATSTSKSTCSGAEAVGGFCLRWRQVATATTTMMGRSSKRRKGHDENQAGGARLIWKPARGSRRLWEWGGGGSQRGPLAGRAARFGPSAPAWRRNGKEGATKYG